MHKFSAFHTVQDFLPYIKQKLVYFVTFISEEKHEAIMTSEKNLSDPGIHMPCHLLKLLISFQNFLVFVFHGLDYLRCNEITLHDTSIC